MFLLPGLLPDTGHSPCLYVPLLVAWYRPSTSRPLDSSTAPSRLIELTCIVGASRQIIQGGCEIMIRPPACCSTTSRLILTHPAPTTTTRVAPRTPRGNTIGSTISLLAPLPHIAQLHVSIVCHSHVIDYNSKTNQQTASVSRSIAAPAAQPAPALSVLRQPPTTVDRCGQTRRLGPVCRHRSNGLVYGSHSTQRLLQ